MSVKVSCITPTFGRFPDYAHLLSEAVESFLQSPYRNKEMVVLNDHPKQVLMCDAPGVRVINCPARIASLGEKYNAMVRAASGEYILGYEDDDISLPHRIEQAVERLSRGYDYFNPQRSWFLNGKELSHDHTHGVCHNASAFTRSAWEAVGGYPAISGAQDAVMDTRLKKHCRVAPPLTDDPSTYSYIYRWSVSPVHLSGDPDPERRWREHGRKPVQAGVFRIEPYWREDYSRLCREACEERMRGA